VGLTAFIDAVRLSERVAAFPKRCRPFPPPMNSTVMLPQNQTISLQVRVMTGDVAFYVQLVFGSIFLTWLTWSYREDFELWADQTVAAKSWLATVVFALLCTYLLLLLATVKIFFLS
jgi:hypothetical protein